MKGYLRATIKGYEDGLQTAVKARYVIINILLTMLHPLLSQSWAQGSSLNIRRKKWLKV